MEGIKPNAAKIAKEYTPELDFINYTGLHMPPMFIWHKRYDKYVPPVNPIMTVRKAFRIFFVHSDTISENIPLSLRIAC